jgi:hypothetical protein
VAVFVAGLVGPLAGVVVLARQLDISVFDTALYVVGLFTVGYLPVVAAALGIMWAAAATQIGALALGRYGPYAGGAEPPPRGPLRRALARTRL